MKLLQTMSLMGSNMLIFYYLLRLLGGRRFSYTFYRKLLLLVMVFFLFPFPYFKYRYADVLEKVFPVKEWGLTGLFPHIRYGEPIENFILYTKDGRFLVNHPAFYILSLCSMGIMIISLTAYLSKYKKFRKCACDYDGQEVCGGSGVKDLEELCADMRLRHTVQVRINPYIDSAVTVGVIKPVVLIPQNEVNELVLIHELNHIKCRDMFFTFLTKVIAALNFYNPFAWLLYYEWSRAVELACDEAVLDYVGDERTAEYGNLLIEEAMKGRKSRVCCALGFGLDKKKGLTNARIRNMKNRRKMNGWKRFIAAACTGCMIFVSSLTVFAYEPDVIWETEEIDGTEAEVILYTMEDFEKIEKTRTVELNGEQVSYETKGAAQELIYLDENGEAVVMEYKEPTAETKASCSHTYSEGILTDHKKTAAEAVRFHIIKLVCVQSAGT